MATNLPNWRDPQVMNAYVKDVQRLYQKNPGLKITSQLILSVFAVAFFTFFAIRPTLFTITELNKKIADQNRVNDQLDSKIVQLTEAQQELIDHEINLPIIKLAIPTTPDLEGFARRLEVLAVEENAELEAIQFQVIPLVGERTSFDEPGAATPPSRRGNLFVTFTFTLNGTQASIMSFLNKLETIDRAVAITQITFNMPPLQQQRFYSLTASGNGTIYYEPETER